VFTLLGSLLIGFTHINTEKKITQNKKEFILKNLNEVFPKEFNGITLYDNDLIADSFILTNSELGESDVVIYPAYKNNQPSGAIITSIAKNGYNGPIKVIVGIQDIPQKSAKIIATRVVEHKETPGLGDPIEARRSDWINQFDKRSLQNPKDKQWSVKKDGGEFDQLTGATITPRAVTAAIKQALVYYENNRDNIFRPSNTASLESNDESKHQSKQMSNHE